MLKRTDNPQFYQSLVFYDIIKEYEETIYTGDAKSYIFEMNSYYKSAVKELYEYVNSFAPWDETEMVQIIRAFRDKMMRFYESKPTDGVFIARVNVANDILETYYAMNDKMPEYGGREFNYVGLNLQIYLQWI